ncbi:MAG: hypothetical protein Q8N35_04160 [Methylococcaceae bacterium]|nr:hypothetical protein [Methylococcaceae bacterium]MDZ4156082.1 hypothetical protein [Methylococcales bacterium]MDP2395099.1 hypothetical protein [Methylococcaceae bacterium]MDP3018759.1 hypothetical protein [Methylococcaceae bacterium]MDP3390524.1 hypothetical protein [Methylococcaceae bacterium]
MIDQDKIIVCCPQIVTGGPELLHQLVHELRAIGRDAKIAYYPFNEKFICPEPYRKYDAPQGELRDDPDTFVVIPEADTWITKRLNKAKIGIWWLSVDNYFNATHQSLFRDIYIRYRLLISHRVPMFQMKRFIHLTQSYYAEDFLKRCNIKPYPLTDYIGLEHIIKNKNSLLDNKENIVVYNPKKGQKQTQALIQAYPDINFVPLQNMTPDQVSTLLRRAKLYIDFGPHPGKDRLPREAAIAGCCVVTGRRGSANYHQDVPIQKQYKLNDKSIEYIDQFGKLAKNIFINFEQLITDFDHYRAKIAIEHEIFRSQVRNIFGED